MTPTPHTATPNWWTSFRSRQPRALANDRRGAGGMGDILAEYVLREAMFDAWAAEGISRLLPIQLASIKAYALNGKSCLVVAPTSSDKTVVGEMVGVKRALN